MNLANILEGHFNELIKSNQELSKERLKICTSCLIFKKDSFKCNDKLWINPILNKSSIKQLEGYFKGCGCRLKAKTTLIDEVCPAGK